VKETTIGTNAAGTDSDSSVAGVIESAAGTQEETALEAAPQSRCEGNTAGLVKAASAAGEVSRKHRRHRDRRCRDLRRRREHTGVGGGALPSLSGAARPSVVATEAN
jgi:hypothetical protein